MNPVKLLERAAGTAVHVVRHPIASASYAAGIARGLASAAVHGVTVTGHDPEAGTLPDESAGDATGDPGVPEPQRVPKPVPPPRAVEDQIVIEPEPAGESFATEPKATSRESEHGRAGSDADIDTWYADADDPNLDDEPEGVVASLEMGDHGDPVDSGELNAILSESETLRKAADPDKG
jgi:hypothetical protein